MAQILSDADIEKIENDLILLKSRYVKLIGIVWGVADVLKNDKAKEYLFHGVARRLDVIERCVENIYSVFPLRREALLSREELKDVDINLHAFFVNIFGLLENMAWVVVHENNSAERIGRKNVGLYKTEAQKLLKDGFRNYLNSERMKKWHDEYLKNYRDALSHRIPLYVPPKRLTSSQQEQDVSLDNAIREAVRDRDFNKMNSLQNAADSVGDPAPFFVHSLSETEYKYVVLHAQVITDFGTVEEIVVNFVHQFK